MFRGVVGEAWGKLSGATVRGGDGRHRKGPEGVKGATLAPTRPKGLF